MRFSFAWISQAIEGEQRVAALRPWREFRLLLSLCRRHMQSLMSRRLVYMALTGEAQQHAIGQAQV